MRERNEKSRQDETETPAHSDIRRCHPHVLPFYHVRCRCAMQLEVDSLEQRRRLLALGLFVHLEHIIGVGCRVEYDNCLNNMNGLDQIPTRIDSTLGTSA